MIPANVPRPPNASLHVKDHIPRSSSLASVSDGDDKKYTNDKVAINNTISEKHEKRTRNKDRPDRGVWAPLRRPDRSQSNDGMPPSSEVAQMANSQEAISVSHPTVGKPGEEMVIQNTRVGRGNNWHASHESSLGYGERKADISFANRSEDLKFHGSGRADFSSENGDSVLPMNQFYAFASFATYTDECLMTYVGSHRLVGRRGSVRGPKEMDNTLNSEGKSSKRGSTVYSSHEVRYTVIIIMFDQHISPMLIFFPYHVQRQVWVQKSGSAS